MMIAWVSSDLMAKQRRKDEEISKEVENGLGHCDRADLVAGTSKMMRLGAGWFIFLMIDNKMGGPFIQIPAIYCGLRTGSCCTDRRLDNCRFRA